MFQMPLSTKKVDYIFAEPLNLHLNFWLAIFFFLCEFQEEIELS